MLRLEFAESYLHINSQWKFLIITELNCICWFIHTLIRQIWKQNMPRFWPLVNTFPSQLKMAFFSPIETYYSDNKLPFCGRLIEKHEFQHKAIFVL